MAAEGGIMFRELRRKEKQMSSEETERILKEGLYGVLALDGDEGYPYAVPLNYAYDSGKIYFHAATEGHKLDAIKKNSKASFNVASETKLLPSTFNCLYKSVTAFGKVRVVDDEAVKRRGLEILIQKYSPGFITEGGKYIEAQWRRSIVVEMEVEHLTGKEAN
jgi:nitroimidazol reductase NimA-like FMN-containing flavoprotein (pyridoxamine 5'-phosphate oxidase superfamily)